MHCMTIIKKTLSNVGYVATIYLIEVFQIIYLFFLVDKNTLVYREVEDEYGNARIKKDISH